MSSESVTNKAEGSVSKSNSKIVTSPEFYSKKDSNKPVNGNRKQPGSSTSQKRSFDNSYKASLTQSVLNQHNRKNILNKTEDNTQKEKTREPE